MSGPAMLRNLLSSARNCASRCHYSSDSDAIKLPKRIHRSPTDILRALASTIKRDVLAPHYKYHDDPYLIPYSNMNKRSYALSLEAGRKAAHWIRQEHPDLFNHSVADPKIELFVPTKVYSDETPVTLEDLKKTISNYLVSDAITVFNLLEKQGADIDNETRQSLLELLCYYNGEDGVNEEWLEERWYKGNSKRKNFSKNVWKSNGEAEKVFKSIKPPTPESYSTIISGMAKYGDVDGAMRFYEEACSSNIPLSVNVYNNLIAKVSSVRENHELMWKLVEELLRSMKAKGLKPNLGTFNAALETLSHMASSQYSNKNALQVLSEMKALGITPSLASFYNIINIFYGGNKNSGILHDIIEYLEGVDLKIRDVNDILFFVSAMEICRHKLHHVPLAYRIDRLLHQGDNYNLLGDSYRESQYYRFYLTLICEGEPLEEFMKFYDQLVPNIYTPEPSAFLEILNSIEVQLGYKYIPKLWTDMTLFDLTERQNILERVLELMTQSEDPELVGKMAQIGWNIWEKMENQTRERNQMEWNGAMLSNVLRLIVQNKEIGKAHLVFDKLDRNQNNMTGEPDMGALRDYVTCCIENKSFDAAIKCVRYCQDMGFGEAVEFSSLLEASPELTDVHKQRLNALMGGKS